MVKVDFWGEMACFTPPYGKVDRLSYPVPTPSAVRGMMASIYEKPAEFWWAIRKIEVMKPIEYMSVYRNEVTKKLTGTTPLDMSDPKSHTQRMMSVLTDVKYRVTAEIIPAKGFTHPLRSLEEQAIRRITKGQCFQRPYLGLRECVCYFSLADEEADPIQETRDMGLMVYDPYDPSDNRKDATPFLSLYRAVMVNGVIEVPDYNSPEVLKLGGTYDSLGKGEGAVC